jgi:hypothetical protein
MDPWSTLVSEGPGAAPDVIRQTKRQLRAEVGDVASALRRVEEQLVPRLADVIERRDRGEPVWPVLAYDDVAAGSVPESQREAVRRRGCAVVRGTFPRSRAEEWDRELASYLERNRFFETYRYRDDGIFAGLAAARPSIFPIYWSTPQVEARSDPAMAVVRRFLNGLWRVEGEGERWLDPERDTAYPDRVRRRRPGSSSGGLSPHTDSGSIERWVSPGYQQVYREVFGGDPAAYDPWDAAHRTEVDELPSTVTCSAFRTFQGWTALSAMAPSEGVLHVVPVPEAMAWVLLRALQGDVAEDDLCGAAWGQALPITERRHALLLEALVPIPAIEPGDTVWWHADLVHAVAPVTNQRGWGNVMYIPATPGCERNDLYAKRCQAAFAVGESPPDFAPEHYEAGWVGRARPA